MFKSVFDRFFRNKFSGSIKETVPVQTDGSSTISLWTAGIKYESRLNNVLNCNVLEEVKLVREPGNIIDTNAVHVKRLNGESLGFIGKSRAAMISPLLDDNKIDNKAHIIDLKCDLSKDIYGVKIALNMNPSYVNLFVQKVEINDVFLIKVPKEICIS